MKPHLPPTPRLNGPFTELTLAGPGASTARFWVYPPIRPAIIEALWC